MPSLHIDCHSGVSGQRLVGALVALGLRPSAIEWELGLLPVGDFHLHFDRVADGIRFSIHSGATHTHEQDEDDHHDHGHGHEHVEHHGHDHEGEGCCHEDHGHGAEVEDEAAQDHAHDHSHGGGCCGGHSHSAKAEVSQTGAEIRALVVASELSEPVKERVVAFLDRLATVEAGRRFSTEGMLLRLANLVAVAVGLEVLKVSSISASTLHESRHEADEAVLKLLEGLPLERDVDGHAQIDAEGAAIVAVLAGHFTDAPALSHAKLGIGVGKGCGCGETPALVHLVLGEKE